MEVTPVTNLYPVFRQRVTGWNVGLIPRICAIVLSEEGGGGLAEIHAIELVVGKSTPEGSEFGVMGGRGGAESVP